jgi:tRNA threonylcarbamoyl adenosine modification protein YeaZ
MISLFLDTSNSKLTVAVIDEKSEVVKTFYSNEVKNELSIKVFEIIDKCINEASITAEDIDKIYVSNGPGSFTGIRIGVTIAKTFAWAKNKKIIPVSSLEILATTPVEDEVIVPMIDARRDCVYAGIYDNQLNIILEDSYISLESLKRELPKDKNITFITDDNIDYFNNKKNSNIDVIKIVKKHRDDDSINPHLVNPRYLKMTEAEANLLKSKEND